MVDSLPQAPSVPPNEVRRKICPRLAGWPLGGIHLQPVGRSEVYIRAFAAPEANGAGGVWQVSLEGGLFPVWRHDGKELYWVAPGGRMMAAPIFGGGLDVNTGGEQFDISHDGRFLINTLRTAPPQLSLSSKTGSRSADYSVPCRADCGTRSSKLSGGLM